MKCFFQVDNSHFGRPKTNFSDFQKVKSKKNKTKQNKNKNKTKQKKTVLSSFRHFTSLDFKFFHLHFFDFLFLLFYSIFHCILASLFLVGQQKFHGQKSGGHSAPCPPPPVTPLAPYNERTATHICHMRYT